MNRPLPNYSLRITLSLIAAFVLLFGLFVFYLIAQASGYTAGEEFSPDDFSRRRFFYNRPSWLPITFEGVSYSIAGTDYESPSSELVASLLKQGILVPVSSSPQKWDLVKDNRQPRDSTAYDARILCDYLDMTIDDSSSFWLDWNEKNSDKALILWGEIAKLARASAYARIPAVMDVALLEPDLSLADFTETIKKRAEDGLSSADLP